MAGLLDLNSPTPPSTVPLDPNAQALLDAGVARSTQPTQSFADADNLNASQYAQGLGGTSNNFGGGSAEDSNIQAIKNAYNQQATKQIQDIKQRSTWNAEGQKAQAMQQQAAAATGQQQALTQQYSNLTNIYNQQEAARAGMVNQIFQTADYGIGAQKKSSRTNNGSANPGSAWSSAESPYSAQTGSDDMSSTEGLA